MNFSGLENSDYSKLKIQFLIIFNLINMHFIINLINIDFKNLNGNYAHYCEF